MLIDKHTQETVVHEAFRYRDALTCHAHVILHDWAQAEDVVQEAFLVVFEKWQDYIPGTNLYGWVKRIVFYKAMEASRARKKQPTQEKNDLLETINCLFEDRFDDDRAHKLQQRRQWLQECMSQLRPDAVHMLSDYYWGEKSGDALAEKYKRSVNAVRLSLMRLRGRLRKCISQRELSYEC